MCPKTPEDQGLVPSICCPLQGDGRGAVVGTFTFPGKEAAGNPFHFPMIVDALTTPAFFSQAYVHVHLVLFFSTVHSIFQTSISLISSYLR
jgi:hypothetical protein